MATTSTNKRKHGIIRIEEGVLDDIPTIELINFLHKNGLALTQSADGGLLVKRRVDIDPRPATTYGNVTPIKQAGIEDEND